jgi:hypothetical protein
LGYCGCWEGLGDASLVEVNIFGAGQQQSPHLPWYGRPAPIA